MKSKETKDRLSYGADLTYEFKYIIINYKYGYPILLNDKVVGGVLIRTKQDPEGVTIMFFEGIELEPEYRNKQIGTCTIQMLKEQCDIIFGSITEDEPKPFWLKMGAKFIDLPLSTFPKETLKSIHTETPVAFSILCHPRALKTKIRIEKMVNEMIIAGVNMSDIL